MFGRFTILARILGRPIVPPKKNWCKEKMYTFSGKNIACLPVPKESDSLLNPCSKNSFTTKFHALGHERVQFTNVSLPSGFTIAANFFRADPGAQEKKEKHVSTAIKKSKVQAFPRRLKSLSGPLFKNSSSTNFQGTGPWEGPVHFSGFDLRVHTCGKLFQSWSWSPREERNTWFKSNWKVQSQSLSQKTQIAYSTLTKATDSFSFFFSFPFSFSFSPSSSPSLLLFLFFFLTLSLSLSLAPFLFLFLRCPWKNLRWKRYTTQSTCWTPLTTSTTSITSSSAKTKGLIRFRLSPTEVVT